MQAFKASRAVQPTAWKVRFLRRLVPADARLHTDRSAPSRLVAAAAADRDGGHLLSLRPAERRRLSGLGGAPAEAGTRRRVCPARFFLVACLPGSPALQPSI